MNLSKLLYKFFESLREIKINPKLPYLVNYFKYHITQYFYRPVYNFQVMHAAINHKTETNDDIVHLQ